MFPYSSDGNWRPILAWSPNRPAPGKVWLGGISKRGDPYLRTLLIHGARVVLCHLRRRNQPGWALTLAQHRPINVVAVAMANKMARTVWALLAHDRAYDRDYVSVRPA